MLVPRTGDSNTMDVAEHSNNPEHFLQDGTKANLQETQQQAEEAPQKKPKLKKNHEWRG